MTNSKINYDHSQNNSESFISADSNAVGGDEIPETKNNEPTQVARIRALLGMDVVLLPVITGQKRPAMTDWQSTTLEKMSDPAYLAQLATGNIGVLLGAPSADLCAIDVDDDAAVESFMALNPVLRTTLRTRGARGAQFWIQVADVYPKLTKLKTRKGEDWGEWRADGGQSVIHGIHPDTQKPYTIQHAVEPVEIAFADIVWPEDLKLPWVKEAADLLAEEHGPAYTIGDKGALSINDYYFVVRFQREHLVLWEPLEEEFYSYNPKNGLWEVTSEAVIKWQFGLDLKRAADEVCCDKFLWKRKNSLLASFVSTLTGLIERRDAFKKTEPVIHLANGMLDLRSDTPKLLSFHPDHYSRNICPLAFDPAAECPRFVKELLGAALNDDDVDLLQRWTGSVLLGRNSSQRVLLLTGTAGGGKSTVIEVIEKVIGERNVAQLRTKHLNKQFELYRFLGKTMLTGKEVGAEFLSDDGAVVIKALVGNDLLDAEKKNGNEQFQLRGNFNVAITCNSRLRVKLEGDSGAWERRLMIINYTKAKPKERITEFADKLIAAEGPGILNWMIEGAIKYLQDEADYGDFQLTDEQKHRVADLLAESDSVRQFVKDRVVPCEGSDITVEELEQHYQEYCEDCSWRATNRQDFRSTIADILLDTHHAGKRHDILRGLTQKRGFKGITILGGGQ